MTHDSSSQTDQHRAPDAATAPALTFTEQAIRRVETAISLVGKSEFARRAEVPRSTIRDLFLRDWKCGAHTLIRLEQAAIAVEQSHTQAAA